MNTARPLIFAKEIPDLSREDLQIMYHTRKSLLLSNEKPWMKRERNLFDVTMGAYNGVKVCELVGVFMLHKISEKYNKNEIGSYRDDGHIQKYKWSQIGMYKKELSIII